MRELLKHFVLFLIAPLQLVADLTILDSGMAEYDGKVVTLTDHVQIENEIGTIAAEKVIMLPWVYNNRRRYPLMQLRENVAINLNDGGQLFCSSADIDYRRFRGRFFGNHVQEYVVYNESRTDKKGRTVEIVVKSRQMGIAFDKQEKQERGHVKEIMAEDNVTINYNRNYIASGDTATYRRHLSGNLASGVSGVVTLKASHSGGTCQVTNTGGDTIRGAQVTIDTRENLLTFDQPVGTVHSNNEQNIEFQSQKLLWDHNTHTLFLNDDICINEGDSLVINNDHEVRIYNDKNEKKCTIKKIHATGLSDIEYDDGNMDHRLTCDGDVVIDHEQLTVIATNRNSSSHVHFYDRYGQIYADQMTFYYQLVDKQLIPKKILLNGNVSLVNQFPGVGGTSKANLQYAVADEAIYFPETRVLKLLSSKHKRVLLYDKVNNLQVSAPELSISRDKKTKKNSIKGVGDVKFSFKDKEFQQFKKRVFMEGT